MLRFILNICGWFFSAFTTGAVFTVMIFGSVFWMYGRDLPDHQALASYEPATISRVYSIEGQVMDEFARERRMFTPADEIPDTVKQAFVSAEDKNFYEHKGFSILAIFAFAFLCCLKIFPCRLLSLSVFKVPGRCR